MAVLRVQGATLPCLFLHRPPWFSPLILTDRPPHRLVSSAAGLGEPLGWARDAAHGRSKQGSRAGTCPAAQGGGTEGQSQPEPPAEAASTHSSPFLCSSQTIPSSGLSVWSLLVLCRPRGNGEVWVLGRWKGWSWRQCSPFGAQRKQRGRPALLSWQSTPPIQQTLAQEPGGREQGGRGRRLRKEAEEGDKDGLSHCRVMGLCGARAELGPCHQWLIPLTGGLHLCWGPWHRDLFLHLLLFLSSVSQHIPRADLQGWELLGGAGSDLQSCGSGLASGGSPARLDSNLMEDSWHFSPNTASITAFESD